MECPYIKALRFFYQIGCDLGGKQAKRNAWPRMYAAAAEIKVFDFFGKISMPQEGRELIIGAVSVNSAECTRGTVLYHTRIKHHLRFDQRLDICLQHPVYLADDIFSCLRDELVPILTIVVRHIDERKPVFATGRRIPGRMFTGNVDINSGIVVDGLVFENGFKLFAVVRAEKNIV